jgi:hypothetical protein
MFCPECGKPLAVATAPEEVVDTAAATTGDGVKTTAEISTASSAGIDGQPISTPTIVETVATPTEDSHDEKPASDKKDPVSEAESKHGARERARETLHRAGSAATSVARHALDDNVKRVEKISHVSTAIYEEATYDPSLRFVLVALGLFIVFVILLVLSKVMG